VAGDEHIARDYDLLTKLNGWAGMPQLNLDTYIHLNYEMWTDRFLLDYLSRKKGTPRYEVALDTVLARLDSLGQRHKLLMFELRFAYARSHGAAYIEPLLPILRVRRSVADEDMDVLMRCEGLCGYISQSYEEIAEHIGKDVTLIANTHKRALWELKSLYWSAFGELTMKGKNGFYIGAQPLYSINYESSDKKLQSNTGCSTSMIAWLLLIPLWQHVFKLLVDDLLFCQNIG
jgi:hypothetical protein